MSNSRASLALLLLQALLVAGCGVPFLPPGCTAVEIRTASLPDGVVGQPYSFLIEDNCRASGREYMTLASSMWAVSGDLPPGITLGAGTGRLTGTPTEAGRFSFVASLSMFSFGVETPVESQTFMLVVRPAS